MIEINSLSELNDALPYGRREKTETLEEVSDYTLHKIECSLGRIECVKEVLEKYPKAKEDNPEEYWVELFNCPCADYIYKTNWYHLGYHWILFPQIKEVLETLDVEPFREEYRYFLHDYNVIMNDKEDRFSKIYRLKELYESAKEFYDDLDKFRRVIDKRHCPPRYWDDDDDY